MMTPDVTQFAMFAAMCGGLVYVLREVRKTKSDHAAVDWAELARQLREQVGRQPATQADIDRLREHVDSRIDEIQLDVRDLRRRALNGQSNEANP